MATRKEAVAATIAKLRERCHHVTLFIVTEIKPLAGDDQEHEVIDDILQDFQHCHEASIRALCRVFQIDGGEG